MLNRRGIFCLILILLIAPFAVLAQAAEPIEYGQTIEGSLTSSALEVRYTFSGQEGDVIVAEHLSEDYDSYLILEQDGVEITYNDDGAGNLDSRIGPFALPSSGEYTLVVTSLSRSDVGDYTVTLDTVEFAPFALGEASSVTFTEEEPTVYFTFEGEQGQVLSFTVDGTIDSAMDIIGPDGYVLTSDDDSGSGNNPEILNFVVSQPGTYTVILRSLFGDAGTAKVVFSESSLPTLDATPQTLSFSGDSPEQSLTFEASPNTVYRLTIRVVEGDTASPSIDMSQNGYSVGYFSSSSIHGLSVEFSIVEGGTVIARFSEYSYSDVALEVTLEEVAQ